MIRFDGYYVEEPTQIYDGRGKGTNEEKSSFSFNAFLFFDNGIVKIRSKHDKLNYLSHFTKEEFLGYLSLENRYTFFKDQIKIDMPHAPHSFTFIEIKNQLVLYNNASEKKMFFISWKEINNLKLFDFENSFLNKKFGPFYHEKYKIYYI